MSGQTSDNNPRGRASSHANRPIIEAPKRLQSDTDGANAGSEKKVYALVP